MPKVLKGSFAMPLQYLQEKGKDEVDFLHADKHKLSQYQFLWAWSVVPKVPKLTSLQNLTSSLLAIQK